ncbi:GreA/GreB family elongation factor [Tabrizicola oligotrophica]|uniref:Transcription elongation factor n=1 Tax=Tabrizicola oligotrophica TaxID=2710650 RepID=A0A6M0QTE7_9RHOB|nr:GreA/GreB family elongation factor [Tabrizicola oligotrophica]NEY90736.1 transcription elongation factor [Tabrizicola oligotrophica]
MSRAFVKEGTGELEPLPDLPVSPHPNYVTPRGLATLKARLLARQGELAALKARAERLDRLPEAAAERDIRYLEARLRTAILVEPVAQPAAEVQFGTRVVVEMEGVERAFEIVGEDEADADLGRIAPHSPLARALIGAEVGDLVVWRRPAGAVELEVVAIAPLDPGA